MNIEKKSDSNTKSLTSIPFGGRIVSIIQSIQWQLLCGHLEPLSDYTPPVWTVQTVQSKSQPLPPVNKGLPLPPKNKKIGIFGFEPAGIVDMAILKFWIFRQNFEFWHFWSISSSKGHLWTLRVIFSIKKSIYGAYGPYISGWKSIIKILYRSYGPDISCRKAKYGP